MVIAYTVCGAVDAPGHGRRDNWNSFQETKNEEWLVVEIVEAMQEPISNLEGQGHVRSVNLRASKPPMFSVFVIHRTIR